MGTVKTNNCTFSIAREASAGVLPGSPVWNLLEPNDIGSFGATISKVAREPISQNRQRRKGTTIDLESGAEIEHDLTLAAADVLLEPFMFAATKWARSQSPIKAGGTPYGLSLAVANATDFTHSAISALLPANTLIYTRGFTNPANNGLKVVAASSTTTVTKVAGGLVAETPSAASGARLEIAGVRAATADLTLTVSGTTGTLGSTALNFTTLGLNVGQVIHIGGLTSTNWFGATNRGFARITSIAATSLGLDKVDSTLVTDAGTGDTVDLLFGSFLRNVPVTSADYLEISSQIEASYPNLGDPTTNYEYSKGNYANELTFELPLTEKATISVGFVGTDTEVPTTTQKTNASTPVVPVATDALNTVSDLARLRLSVVDAAGLTTCFTNLSITLNNQVSPQKCLGTLGAVSMNFGIFLVDIEAEMLFTSATVVEAIRNNTSMTLDLVLRNSQGGLAIDIPAMTLGGGEKAFPLNEAVTITVQGEAHGDPTFGYSLGISYFPALPTA